MSEQMRSEFEAWIAQHHDGVKHARGLEMVLSGERYASMEVEWAYRAWQASRAALCVELPVIVFDDDMNKAEWVAIKSALAECKQAIHAAGVKTK